MRKVEIVYRAGKDNLHADALSRQPHLPAPAGVAQGDVQVCAVSAVNTLSERDDTVDALLQADPEQRTDRESYDEEQQKDDSIRVLVNYLDGKVLPEYSQSARKVVLQASSFTQILYFIDVKQGNLQRVVVPHHLTQQMTEYHSSIMSGHFSGVMLCIHSLNVDIGKACTQIV